MQPPNSCIRLTRINKSIGKKQVLFDIDWSIPYAQIIGILGPSGSGKTTLVKLIAGIDEATSGEVQVLDQKMPNLELMKKIGYMAQADALYVELTAEENLHFFGSMYGIPREKKKQRIQEVMELVDLTPFLKRQVKHFSGGMKRRLSLAISLLHEPPVLILDEPTVGIDPILRQAIWEELRGLRDRGTTILVTTHVMDELPLYYAADALRNIMIRGHGWEAVALNAFVLLGLCIVFALMNMMALKKHRKI